MSPHLRTKVALLALIASFGAPSFSAASPVVYLWAWNRSEDLTGLPSSYGVASMQALVELSGATARVKPRSQPLSLKKDTPYLPVVHVDAFPAWQPELNAAQHEALVNTVVKVAHQGGRQAVQIDFEARPSQRLFYREVLVDVRRRLPGYFLSITALSSWCLGDAWLGNAPVDEVVAMAFRMGHQASRYRQQIGSSHRWSASECTSTGISTDEPLTGWPASKRVFVFSPKRWDGQALAQLNLSLHGNLR